MKILFDQGGPAPLRRHLPTHVVHTAFERGWSSLRNSKLLDQAETDGYRLLVTTDQNLRLQQNLADRRLAIVELQAASWRRIQQRVDDMWTVVEQMGPG